MEQLVPAHAPRPPIPDEDEPPVPAMVVSFC